VPPRRRRGESARGHGSARLRSKGFLGLGSALQSKRIPGLATTCASLSFGSAEIAPASTQMREVPVGPSRSPQRAASERDRSSAWSGLSLGRRIYDGRCALNVTGGTLLHRPMREDGSPLAARAVPAHTARPLFSRDARAARAPHQTERRRSRSSSHCRGSRRPPARALDPHPLRLRQGCRVSTREMPEHRAALQVVLGGISVARAATSSVVVISSPAICSSVTPNRARL
jgi:hypothetical protein